MSLLDDEMLAQIVGPLGLSPQTRVLDAGCGRGFLARWLRWTAIDADYTGIDRVPEAIRAARRFSPGQTFVEGDYRSYAPEPPFDVAVAFETSADGTVDDALLAAMRRCLRDGGRFVATASSYEGLERRLETHFPQFELLDRTAQAAAFARRLYGAILEIDPWDERIKSRLYAQARAMLAAVDGGRFRYAVISGQT